MREGRTPVLRVFSLVVSHGEPAVIELKKPVIGPGCVSSWVPREE